MKTRQWGLLRFAGRYPVENGEHVLVLRGIDPVDFAPTACI
jgi:hypothetical protein